MLASGTFSRVSFEGSLVRLLPAVSAVVVLGLGVTGLLHVQLAKLRGHLSHVAGGTP